MPIRHRRVGRYIEGDLPVTRVMNVIFFYIPISNRKLIKKIFFKVTNCYDNRLCVSNVSVSLFFFTVCRWIYTWRQTSAVDDERYPCRYGFYSQLVFGIIIFIRGKSRCLRIIILIEQYVFLRHGMKNKNRLRLEVVAIHLLRFGHIDASPWAFTSITYPSFNKRLHRYLEKKTLT